MNGLKSIFFALIFFVGIEVSAITAQQYCEALHAKRANPGDHTSEILKEDVTGTSFGENSFWTFSRYIKTTKKCIDGSLRLKISLFKINLTAKGAGGVDEYGVSTPVIVVACLPGVAANLGAQCTRDPYEMCIEGC